MGGIVWHAHPFVAIETAVADGLADDCRDDVDIPFA